MHDIPDLLIEHDPRFGQDLLFYTKYYISLLLHNNNNNNKKNTISCWLCSRHTAKCFPCINYTICASQKPLRLMMMMISPPFSGWGTEDEKFKNTVQSHIGEKGRQDLNTATSFQNLYTNHQSLHQLPITTSYCISHMQRLECKTHHIFRKLYVFQHDWNKNSTCESVRV